MGKIKEIWQQIIVKDDEVERYEEDQANSKYGGGGNVLKSILNGNWLTWDMISRQRILILLIAILVIGYIDNRYRSEQERAKVARLQKEVISKRYEDLEVSAHLVEMSRQSHVIERLKEYNSQLRESNTPAVRLDD